LRLKGKRGTVGERRRWALKKKRKGKKEKRKKGGEEKRDRGTLDNIESGSARILDREDDRAALGILRGAIDGKES